MTAVIYARYSSDNQREESIEGQIRECTAYAEKNGVTVIKHYIDRALSAKTDNRPDFQQMIKDSEKRLFDIVLVWKLDRFARNRYDSAHYEYQLERNHVKLVSATEPISDSPAGIMVKSMLTGMAEYYSAELSEKVVRGMTENVLKGKYNGGTIPIGFKVDEEKFFQIDPLKAPFVVEAFQRYNEGATMKELMNWLNDSGVTTNRNQKFTYNSVQKLLTNKRYIGENRFKDIVMPDSIPAIVDKDLFEEVQQKIKKNSRAPARHKAEDDYLLTTKLFCGMCGAMMFGECGTGRNKVVHHYYKGRADADDLPRSAIGVQTKLQTGAFGGFHECERFRVFPHQSGAQLCTCGQRCGNARLPGKQHGFFFLCQSLVHFADDRKILPAVHRPTGHDGMLTVKDEVVTVPVADLGRVGNQLGELCRHLFDIGNVQLALIFRRDFEKGTVDDLFLVRPLGKEGFDDGFIRDFGHDLRHGADTVHILHSSSSILSSKFFR